jgi:hypothetical protein
MEWSIILNHQAQPEHIHPEAVKQRFGSLCLANYERLTTQL